MRIVTVVLPLVVALAGCVSRVGPEAASTASPSPTSEPAGKCDIEVRGEPGEEPEVTLPERCPAPTTLRIEDLVTGDGPKAAKGSDVTVNYVLFTWSDRARLESTWDTAPFVTADLDDDARHITGWHKSLLGIREGGRRLAVIPPDDGYGSSGNGAVGPDETLVFVIDAVTVTG